MEYIIEEIRRGEQEGGIACGPIGGAIVTSVKFNDGKTSKYFYISYLDGELYFLSKEDIYDILLDDTLELDDERFKFSESKIIENYKGINLDCYYGTLFKSLKSSKARKINKKLIRAIYYISKCDNLEDAKKLFIGKKLSEVDFIVEDEKYYFENKERLHLV